MEENAEYGKVLSTVERKVRNVAELFKSEAQYLFMNWAQANVALGKIKKPTIVYVLPPSGDLDFSWHDVKDYPETMIGFLAYTKGDFHGDVNDGIIESMKRLAIRFVNALNESGYFEHIEGKVPYKVVYDFLDDNVTGVILTIPLEEIKGVMICDLPVRDGDALGSNINYTD